MLLSQMIRCTFAWLLLILSALVGCTGPTLAPAPNLYWATNEHPFDDTPEVTLFANTLERVCVETVEAGHMTKDLALLIAAEAPWLTTTQFMDKLDENLKRAVG